MPSTSDRQVDIDGGLDRDGAGEPLGESAPPPGILERLPDDVRDKLPDELVDELLPRSSPMPAEKSEQIFEVRERKRPEWEYSRE